MDNVTERWQSVVVLAPTDRDARTTCEIMGAAGIDVIACAGIRDLARAIEDEVGAVLLTDESLKQDGSLATIARTLQHQPPWSDLPVVLLASGGASSSVSMQALESLGNVLILDRPVHVPTLCSAIRTVLRGRQRQYELRDRLTELERTEEALRRSEERFREVLENSLDAAYRRNLANDQYDYVSPVVKQVFDMEPERFRSMSLTEFLDRIHPDDHDEVFRAIEAGTATGSGRVEYRFRGDDGKYRWLADHFTVQKDTSGTPLSRGGIVREITDLRKAQDALRDNDRRKDEFLAMLSHELRNPLAAITTGLQLLKSSSGDHDREVTEILERQTRQVVRLVDDLLDVSRITRGKIQLKPTVVDLRVVVENAVESTAGQIEEKHLTLNIVGTDLPLLVFADAARLQQIVSNLLSNSAKYTPDGGQVQLILEGDSSHAVVQVRDNGIGIPVDMQEAIFELFGQVESAMHRPQQGLGIGLSLVKMLVELHGGTVNVASEGQGCGSEFTVRLPRLHGPVDQGEGNVGQFSESPPLDVLLVEDDRTMAELLATVIGNHGHTVRVADDGFAALRLARQRPPDVVLLDIGLPGISGYDVAERLRAEAQCRNTLIIAATGYGQERDRQRSRDAGIDHHLIKPVEYATLALLMREWLRTVNRPPTDAPIAARDMPAPPRKPARILIIDDAHAIARMTQAVLQRDGHQVEIAFDGQQGVEAARQFRPDLILCDLNMPRWSGYDVVRALRADSGLQNSMLVAVTGYDDDSERQQTAQAGFDAHIVKPISLKSFQDLIRKLPK